MKLIRRLERDGTLAAAYLAIGPFVFAVGCVLKYLGGEWPIAFNRDISWRYDRKACLSLFRLRLGFAMRNRCGLIFQ